MQRLQSVIPGPINSVYGETVAGTAVIRCKIGGFLVSFADQDTPLPGDMTSQAAEGWPSKGALQVSNLAARYGP